MNQNKQKSKEEMEEEISILNKAEETSTIMTLLCEKLGLVPKETTFEAFRDAFGGLQMKALEIRKEMQSQFISSMEAKKPRKKREKIKYDPNTMDQYNTDLNTTDAPYYERAED